MSQTLLLHTSHPVRVGECQAFVDYIDFYALLNEEGTKIWASRLDCVRGI